MKLSDPKDLQVAQGVKCHLVLSELPNYKPRTAWKTDRFRPNSKGKRGVQFCKEVISVSTNLS